MIDMKRMRITWVNYLGVSSTRTPAHDLFKISRTIHQEIVSQDFNSKDLFYSAAIRARNQQKEKGKKKEDNLTTNI